MAIFCDTSPGLSGALLYAISVVAPTFITLSTCHDETEFDTKLQVFQDSIEGRCVTGSDDIFFCYNRFHSHVQFSAEATITYIVVVTGSRHAEGIFKLSVQCT